MNTQDNFHKKLSAIFQKSGNDALGFEEIIEKYQALEINSEPISEIKGNNTFYEWIKQELNEHSSFGLLAIEFQTNQACINNKAKSILNIEKPVNGGFDSVKNLINLVEKKSDFMALLKNARKQKQKILGDFKLKFFEENQIKWVNLEGHYNFDQNNKPLSFFCSIVDITAKKKNDKFQKLINSVVTDAKHAVIITEAEPINEPGPRILYVNETYTKMTGYSAEEAIGQTPRFMQGSETDPVVLKTLKDALKSWEPCKVEVINYRKNGEKFWVELDIKPIKNSDGYYTHWVSVQRDITEAKNTEAKLIESETRYRTLIDDSLELIQSIGNQGEILFVNKLWKKTLEYTDEEIENLNIFDIIVDESKEQCLLEYEMIMRGESIYDVKTIFKSKSGKIIHLEGSSVPRIVDGKVVGTQGFFKDITEQIESENKKKLLEKSLKNVQSIAKVGEFSYNFKSEKCNCSETVGEIYGIDSNHINTIDGWFSLMHPEHLNEVRSYFTETLNSNKVFDKEFKIIRKNDNQERWVKCMGEFEFDNLNKPLQFTGTVKDITEQINTTEELSQVNTRLDYIFNSLDEVFFTLDVKNQKIVEISQACEKIFGYTQQDFFDDYNLPFKITHPDDLSKLEKDREKMHLGESIINDFRIIDKKGNTKWIELKVKATLNADLELIKVEAITRDISRRKFGETILKETLNQLNEYKYAIDMSAIVSITDEKGVITYVNETFCKISQYSEIELLGKNHKIVNSNYHDKDFFIQMWKTISSGEIWKGVVKNKAKDGSYYWVESTIIPFLRSGVPYQYISIRYDITEKVNISEKIEQQKYFYETILNEIPADIAVFDHDHKYLFINPNGVKDPELRIFLIGKDDYEYCNLKNKDISIADSRRKVFNDAIDSKIGISMEESILNKENRYEHKLRRFYPVFNEDNTPKYVIGFGIDITKKKEQEILLEASLAEKETLLGEIHHRVKNNLAVIDGLLELKKYFDTDKVNTDTLTEVQMRIKVIALVHEKLYQTESFSNIKLNDYLHDLANHYQKIFNKPQGDTVEFEIEAEDVSLDISKSITFGLLLNELISNSLKYGIINKKVKIKIEIKLIEEMVNMIFSDSGHGVPEEVKTTKKGGFGYKLIDTFTRQLKASLVFADKPHLEIEMKFPLNKIKK